MSDHEKDNLRSEEAQDVTEATESSESAELTEEDLEEVAGGAFPTSVNNQITDSVTQT